MAGSYADVPGPRMAYDRDGSIGFFIDEANNVSALSQGELNNGNDENTGSTMKSYGVTFGATTQLLGIIFPELRDIAGLYIAMSHPSGQVQTSVDTTNGLDGTWVNRGTTSSFNKSNVVTEYRLGITAVSWGAVKAVRFAQNNSGSRTINTFHLYGSITSGQNPDRLRLWHPTLDQEVGGAYFDWGNVPQSSSADRSFRVKNNSAALTANGITVAFSALSDTSPSVVGQHLVEKSSAPGFGASVVLSSLSPGAISEVLTVRRVSPSNAVLSLWWARVTAVASSWT